MGFGRWTDMEVFAISKGHRSKSIINFAINIDMVIWRYGDISPFSLALVL